MQAHHYTPSSDTYQEKHRRYPELTGRVVALEEEGMALANHASGEESESEVEAMDGINVCLAQVMSHYQRESRNALCVGQLAILLRTVHTVMPLRDGTVSS